MVNEVLMGRPSGRVLALRYRLRDMIWRVSQYCSIYGLYPWQLDESWVTTDRYPMVLPASARGFAGTTIVQLSDLHCSPVMSVDQLRKYVEIANRMEPDYFVVTGDFITITTRRYARKVAELLRDLAPRHATFACLGNHDYGLWIPNMHRGVPIMADYIAEELHKVGVRTLVDERVTLERNGSRLHIIGLADIWADCSDPFKAFDGVGVDDTVIALCHNPDGAQLLASLGANYVLSGHTHGRPARRSRVSRLLWPTSYQQYRAGHYELGGGRYLYVNRGIGHARRTRRIHQPEITHFTILCDDAEA